MLELSVSRLMQMLREAPESHPKDFLDQLVLEPLSDGVSYLWINVVRPLLLEKNVTISDIDFSIFSYEDLEETGLIYLKYFHELNAEYQKAVTIWSGLSKASPQNTSIFYV